MNRLLFAIFLAVIPSCIHAQELEDFVKKSTESSLDYILRVKPNEDNLTFKILESYEWDSKNPSIIAFYEIPHETDYPAELMGHIYMKQYDVDYYRDIVFGNFVGEIEYPEIIDVFWMNIDEDKEKELFVLSKYYSRHYDFTGYIYDLSILDNPTMYDDRLDSLDLFGDEFVSFEGVTGDGSEIITHYKTKEEVISKIHELGY